MVAVPARHPLLAHKRIPLDELLRYPLVLCDQHVCEGHAKHIDRILRRPNWYKLCLPKADFQFWVALSQGGV